METKIKPGTKQLYKGRPKEIGIVKYYYPDTGYMILTYPDGDMEVHISKCKMIECMSGAELISLERDKQLNKGRNAEHDQEYYPNGELTEIAGVLASASLLRCIDQSSLAFEPKVLSKYMNRQYIERLMIAGAFIAAEIDRVKLKEAKESANIRHEIADEAEGYYGDCEGIGV